MTVPEINEILNGIELTYPVSLDDVAQVRAALGGDVEIFTRVRELVVQVHRDGKQMYERILPIAGAPPARLSPKYP